MKPKKCLGRLGFGLLLAFLALGLATPARAQNAGALFVPGPDLKIPRTRHYTATLPDGLVAVFGGVVGGDEYLDIAEIWSLGDGYFFPIQMEFPRVDFAFARMQDGRYLLAGGAPTRDTVEFFDPYGVRFEYFGRLNIPRQGCSAAALAEGQVLVVGGKEDYEAAMFAEVMDPSSGPHFEVTGPLKTPRSFPVVLPTSKGAVVAGGYDVYDPEEGREATELFDMGSFEFRPLSETLLPGENGWQVTGADYLVSMEAQLLPDGRYLLLARRPVESGWDYTLVAFDPIGLKFVRLATNPPLPQGATTRLLTPVVDRERHRVYIPAYVNFDHTLPISLRLYTLNLGTGALNAPTGSFLLDYFPTSAWTLLPDGRLLTCGGSLDEGNTKGVQKTLFATPEAGGQSKFLPAILNLLLL